MPHFFVIIPFGAWLAGVFIGGLVRLVIHVVMLLYLIISWLALRGFAYVQAARVRRSRPVPARIRYNSVVRPFPKARRR